MGKQETKDHVIITDKESSVPLDPGGIFGELIGHQMDRTIRNKETGQIGKGTGENSTEKAWNDLRSKNEADKR